MKRCFALWLVLALLCPLTALGEANAAETLMPDFEGLSGSVRFVLPGTPAGITVHVAPGFLVDGADGKHHYLPRLQRHRRG